MLLLIPLGLLLVVDAYFFQILKTVLIDYSDKVRWIAFVAYWLLSITIMVLVFLSSDRSLFPVHVRYYIFSGLLVFLIPKLMGCLFLLSEDLYRLGGGLIGLFRNDEGPFLGERRKFISSAALITASIPFASMIYGMVKTGFNIRLRKSNVVFDELPEAFDGLKIVQISDLHSGSFANHNFFEEAVEQINSLSPDLIFFTGDLVNNEAIEAERFVPTIRKLNAKYGVHSILGNHDYGDYGPWPNEAAKLENFNRLKKIHSDAGWNLLTNGNCIVKNGESEIAIIGVENWGASRHFPRKGDLDKAANSVEHIDFKILLSHDPSHWEAKVLDHPQKFQLTLSGHTHGAQFGIEIPGFKWSPAQYAYKQWAGLYEGKDGQKLYVNRGLGFIGYMGRIGIPPEITLLELNSKKIT